MCWYDGKRKKNEKKNYRCAEYDGEKKEQKKKCGRKRYGRKDD